MDKGIRGKGRKPPTQPRKPYARDSEKAYFPLVESGGIRCRVKGVVQQRNQVWGDGVVDS
eukprot:scaffold113130_cov31-Tisochrysis_lutea.AAC.3